MYTARYRYRHTAADAADSVTFAMRNPVASTSLIYVHRIILTVGFDGTSAAAQVGHGFRRFFGANPTGGTSPSRIPDKTLSPASQVTDASIKDGAVLTLAATFEGYFHELVVPASAGSVLSHVMDFMVPFRLEKGEGIAVSNVLVAVIGTTIGGSIWWTEETI